MIGELIVVEGGKVMSLEDVKKELIKVGVVWGYK